MTRPRIEPRSPGPLANTLNSISLCIFSLPRYNTFIFIRWFAETGKLTSYHRTTFFESLRCMNFLIFITIFDLLISKNGNDFDLYTLVFMQFEVLHFILLLINKLLTHLWYQYEYLILFVLDFFVSFNHGYKET